MPTNVKRRAEEICVKGEAIEYLGEVTKLVQIIISDRCEIACDYVSDCSRLQESFDDARPNRIWISVHKVRNKPVHIVWDIMHEFGHHRSGKPEKGEIEDPERRLKREELAWIKAQEQLEKFPTLKQELSDFLAYKDYCLIGYRNAAMSKK